MDIEDFTNEELLQEYDICLRELNVRKLDYEKWKKETFK